MPGNTPSAALGPVSITRTGGIAGVNQSVEITADGGWVYTDRRANKTERGTLTAEQQLRLLNLVRAPGFADQILASPAPHSGCADSFRYIISVGDRSTSFDDCGQDERPAVAALLAAVADATPL
ncbi:MAG TPA: hypothetical protein VF163_05430 [Micromonosporaceae bacterium]